MRVEVNRQSDQADICVLVFWGHLSLLHFFKRLIIGGIIRLLSILYFSCYLKISFEKKRQRDEEKGEIFIGPDNIVLLKIVICSFFLFF